MTPATAERPTRAELVTLLVEDVAIELRIMVGKRVRRFRGVIWRPTSRSGVAYLRSSAGVFTRIDLGTVLFARRMRAA